jgi:hypothetical protein
MANELLARAMAYVRTMEPAEREQAMEAAANVMEHLADLLQGRPRRELPPPSTPLQRQTELAKKVLEIEKARIQFLKDENIPEDSPMAEEVNVIFTDLMTKVRLGQ